MGADLILDLMPILLGSMGALAGAFGAGFAVGRSRGKTEAYADIAAKRKRKKKG